MIFVFIFLLAMEAWAQLLNWQTDLNLWGFLQGFKDTLLLFLFLFTHLCYQTVV